MHQRTLALTGGFGITPGRVERNRHVAIDFPDRAVDDHNFPDRAVDDHKKIGGSFAGFQQHLAGPVVTDRHVPRKSFQFSIGQLAEWGQMREKGLLVQVVGGGHGCSIRLRPKKTPLRRNRRGA